MTTELASKTQRRKARATVLGLATQLFAIKYDAAVQKNARALQLADKAIAALARALDTAVDADLDAAALAVELAERALVN